MARAELLSDTVRCVDRAAEARPASERRLLFVVIGVLVAASGVAVMLLSLLGLLHPGTPFPESRTPTDVSGVLTDLVWVGALLAVAGAGTAVVVVRAHLRSDGSDR